MAKQGAKLASTFNTRTVVNLSREQLRGSKRAKRLQKETEFKKHDSPLNKLEWAVS